MPAIYTSEWYDSLKELLNRSDEVTANAPCGVWNFLVEIKGDKASPYLAPADVKHFAIALKDGKCDSYRELVDAPPRKDFQFIMELPATLFERIVANLADPVAEGLKGAIRITGDMRMVMQHAELVNSLSKIYQREVNTDWPKGKPPYPAGLVAREEARNESQNAPDTISS
jgi:hypothetical protein